LQLQFLIHLFRVSSGFHFYTHAFRSLHGVFYALPIVHDTSSKNAQVSPATTSFPWRHTKGSATHKAGCRGGQADAGDRGCLRSGDARQGAAAKSGLVW